jgi:diguanylate cyclase (GGDEF)-like protein/PAS domain S-box-containing protein
MKRLLGGRTALALGAWVVYVVAFVPLYRQVGPTVTALAALPVIVIGWLFGMRGGLLAGLLAFLLDVLLTDLVGEAGWDVMLRRGLPGTALLFLVGAVVGRLRDLGEQVKRELAERKRAERELEERRLYLEGVLGAAPDAIVTLDAHHRIVEWNLGAERLFGYSREEVIGQNIDDLITRPDVVGEAVGFTQTVMGGGEIRATETVRYRKDGSVADVIVAGSPILVGDELIGVVAVYTDISERKWIEEQLAHIATHDALTDLPNRLLLNDRLNQALAHARRHQQKMALMMLDLDYFKQVNDTLGHSVGDQLLQVVGERLTSLVRESDTVARMGGDEFTLILPEVAEAEDAARVAEKILNGFRKPFVLDGHELHVTTSVGLAIYPDDGEDGGTLMKNADIAMYRAKQEGRNNYQRYG